MLLFGLIIIIFLYISNMMISTLTQSQEIWESSIKYLTGLPQLSYYNESNDPKISSCWLVSYAGPVMSRPNYNDPMVQSAKTNLNTNASCSFRLFGIDLTTSTKERNVLEPLDPYQKTKSTEIFEEEKLDHIQTGTSLTEFQRKEISFTTCSTKV